MGLDYRAVKDVDLKPLGEAVTKWKNLPGQFREVGNTFLRSVSSPLRSSDWEGEAADAAAGRCSQVSSQIDAAAEEAGDVGRLLSDAYEKFKWAKSELESIEAEVAGESASSTNRRYLKLNGSTGTVYLDPPEDEKHQSAALQKSFHDTITAYEKRTQKAIAVASDADTQLKTGLLTDPNGTGKGFSSDGYESLEQVKKATDRDSKEALHLARLGPKMNTEQLTRLNSLLDKQENNPVFAERFATGLGSKGTMRFWYEMAKPVTEQKGPYGRTGDLRSKLRLKLTGKLQDNLGSTLALATHSNSREMKDWKKEVINLGDERFLEKPAGYGGARGPYGFQVMSNLMREGSYDKGLLNSYGDALLKKDMEAYNSGYENKPSEKWISGGLEDSYHLNFGFKDDAGEDPVTGFMEALGHNPDASTDFLKSKSNFDYLMGDREWPEDGDVAHSGKHANEIAGHRSLAHALQSATTGHPYEYSQLGAPPPAHTADQAKVMERFIDGVSDRHDSIEIKPGMHDGVAKAVAEYTPDIFHQLRDGSGKDLFPINGASPDVDHTDVTRLLVDLGQDPQAKGYLTHAQKIYTADVLEHHLSGDSNYGASDHQTIKEVLTTSGEMSGQLSIGQQEALVGPAVVKDADFDQAVLSTRAWAVGAAGFAVGVGTAGAASPLEAAAVTGVVNGATGTGGDAIDSQISSHDSAAAADGAAKLYEKSYDADIGTNKEILAAIAKKHPSASSGDYEGWANDFSSEGFSRAGDWVSRTAPYLDSMDQVKTYKRESG
ncbi:DUF6571 family protein [Streptomyces sp. ODS28]|uniref:DUF6571 family protein n=1 Tax=Streptomyces sp. ODS28 TaxID=3136688 RepID=UPI0031E944DA